jgi:hypothetical protein
LVNAAMPAPSPTADPLVARFLQHLEVERNT